jgi:hypothetical protein
LEIHAKPPAEKSQVRVKRGSSLILTDLSLRRRDAVVVVSLCDHTGRFIAGACQFFPAAVDPEGAEALACKRALQLAKELGCQRLVLETDNANVAAKLNEETRDLSALGPIIEEVKTMLRDIMFYEVKAVRRTGNLVAHKLAREGCMNKCTQTWFSEAPDCIKSALSADVE